MIITSKQNPKIKALLKLRRRRDREEAGVTLIDGYEELRVALAGDAKIQSLYFCPELMEGEGEQAFLAELLKTVPEALQLDRAVFEKAAYRESPDGWLAVVASLDTRLEDLKLSDTPLLLVCEAVEKPGNLGAMLRTADAAGVDAVIAVSAATDWSNPNIIRASKGAVFSTPVATAGQQELADWLRARNIAAVAATPDTDTPYTHVNLTAPAAIFVGTEKHGLSDFWLQRADSKVRIPMVGKVDSLNVATSAALLVYEAVRQRTQNRQDVL